jgi:hypothetical protein
MERPIKACLDGDAMRIRELLGAAAELQPVTVLRAIAILASAKAFNPPESV